MLNFKPKDVIAALVVVSFAVLRYNGVDNGFDAPLALILGYYFVKRENGQDHGK